jgi:small-conductance mechanosensitive channel/CRP-like cAMP-binding protein
MSDVVSQPWFFWAVLVVIGLPVASIVLTEVNAWLVRRRSQMARPVQLLRIYLLPVGALLVLLTQIPNSIIANDGAGVKLVATVFGLLLLIFILSALNTALFLNAEQRSWRGRMPSIFVDIGRIVLIAVGLAVLFSFVWGADVGGLFTALGVTSIVLGLALQTAVGSIIAGLLLLFEQPFRLGDWLRTESGTGRVVEVNWRSVHIDMDNEVAIVPNSSLATSAFTNLSRPTVAYTQTVNTSFTDDDAPLAVLGLLDEVANGLMFLADGQHPSSRPSGGGAYETSLPLSTYADAEVAKAQFLTRIWYAARRRGLALDGADTALGKGPADVGRVLAQLARIFALDSDQVDDLAPQLTLERYAEGEVIERAGSIPVSMRYISSGQVVLRQPLASGSAPLLSLGCGDFLGQAALTRTPQDQISVAVTEVETLVIPTAVLDELARADHRLAREFGRQLDRRRHAVDEALAELAATAGAITQVR